MPLDAICVSALTAELSAQIAGMKIDKIQQCEKTLLLLNLHGKGENQKLLLSASQNSARVNLTAESFEQPASPPMFCMLLRKHIQGGRIIKVENRPFEREISFRLGVYEESGEYCEKLLIAELRGRGANIILVGADGIIIDCLRRVDAEMNPIRQLLPGLFYHPPETFEKPIFFTTAPELRREMLFCAKPDTNAEKWLLDSFAALCPLICREITFRATGQISTRISDLSEKNKLDMLSAMDEIIAAAKNPIPTMLADAINPIDFSFTDILQYQNACGAEKFSGFSPLLDSFFTKRDKKISAENRSKALIKTVKTLRDRSERKLALRREELSGADNMQALRKYGDLITANLYRMKKGDSRLIAQDYFIENFSETIEKFSDTAEDFPELMIPLDPLKTPQQNAAKYYRDYNRQKSARTYLSALIEKNETEIFYLDSVLTELSLAESERELLALRLELEDTGYIKKSAKKQKNQSFYPLRFKSDSGIEILVGRSNTQNDELTFKIASRGDIWLHAQKIHGAHVILRTGGAEPDDTSLSMAASLAVYFSSAKDGGKTAVDYTAVKNVKKPSGALPGMVIYSNQKTIISEGNSAPIEEIINNKGKTL